MNDRELMQQALDALSTEGIGEASYRAAEALRARLAQIEPALDDCDLYYEGDVLRCIESGENAIVKHGNTSSGLKLSNGLICLEWSDGVMGEYTFLQLREGFRRFFPNKEAAMAWQARHTAPLQCNFIGLTDEEIEPKADVADSYASFYAGVRFAEAKLREKNT